MAAIWRDLEHGEIILIVKENSVKISTTQYKPC